MARPLALTMGEPAGIGGELTLKSWLSRRQMNLPPFFVIDDGNRLSALAGALGLDVPVQTIAAPADALSAFPHALPVLHRPLNGLVTPGQPDPAHAPLVISAVEEAVRWAQGGDVAAVVTNPIHKPTLEAAGFGFPGHTEFIAHLCDVQAPVMMLVSSELRVVLATVHLPLAEAVRVLSEEKILIAARAADAALRGDFGIERPRLVVAGLNPHAGDDGMLGSEESLIISPAVRKLSAQGINVLGPFPADTLFHAQARIKYDAAICMYHDQALIPLKTLDFAGGVNVTLGLPVVRTSPDHGTAFDIAGRGIADAASLMHALQLGAQISDQRIGSNR